MSGNRNVDFTEGLFAHLNAGSTIVAKGTGGFTTAWQDVDTSIYADYAIIAPYMYIHQGTASASDTRIKKDVEDANDVECLEVLRQLKPKKYKYKDTFTKGTEPVWGFIAQEVRDTLPYATKTRSETIPNIYELANITSSNVITFTDFNTSNLEANTSMIEVMTIGGDKRKITLAEVIDDHSIRVEEDVREWTGSVDETGNVVAGNQLFVYGQEVDDFIYYQRRDMDYSDLSPPRG